MSFAGNLSSQNRLILGDSYGSQIQAYVFSAFTAVAWYNSIELLVLCFTTFKRFSGWYFWSLLIASASLIPYCVGFIFLLFPLGITPYVSVTLIVVFWCGMVTGQSMVLWSRLHLVVHNPKILRGVLCMIVTNACLIHPPVFVLFYGAVSPNGRRFSIGYDVIERIQLVVFCVQELIISGIYVWETGKMLRLRIQQRSHGILLQLLVINVLILSLDLAIVGIEYAGYYAVQVMFKPVAYSVKLKLEYSILGKLVTIAQGDCHPDPSSGIHGLHHHPSVDSEGVSLGTREVNMHTPVTV